MYIYKKKPAKISIIITLYNQIKFISRIYACIQNQSFKNIEIIFIDDGSLDKLIKDNFLQEIKQFYFQKENIFL